MKMWRCQSRRRIGKVTKAAEAALIGVERFSLPKSISVKSNGHLKMAQTGGVATYRAALERLVDPKTPAEMISRCSLFFFKVKFPG